MGNDTYNRQSQKIVAFFCSQCHLLQVLLVTRVAYSFFFLPTFSAPIISALYAKFNYRTSLVLLHAQPRHL